MSESMNIEAERTTFRVDYESILAFAKDSR